VWAVFGELQVPFIAGRDGSTTLQAAVSARYEDYSDFGSTANPKLGIDYFVTPDFKLRGSWGTSFRAPHLSEISPTARPPGASGILGVPDPESPTGVSNVIFLTGGNPDIQEETADIWTVGFDATSLFSQSLTVSATYFSIDYRDKIQSGGALTDTLLFEDQWAEIIFRDPSDAEIDAICSSPNFDGACPDDVAAIIDLRLRNLASLQVRGVDFEATYATPTKIGDLTLDLTATRLLEFSRAVSSTAPSFDVLNTVENPLKLRMRGSAILDLPQWSFSAAANYANEYDDPARAASVGSYLTIDLGVVYRLDANDNSSLVQFNVVNAFDEDAPFVNTEGGLTGGFDRANADQAGRVISASFTKRW
jgi:outer membrane receptor protein involved in Fe transport